MRIQALHYAYRKKLLWRLKRGAFQGENSHPSTPFRL